MIEPGAAQERKLLRLVHESARTGNMKNAHPIITATSSSSLVNPDSSSSNEPTEPIIRLKLDKPLHWEWELTTSADKLPVIQLLDKDGRLLVETTGRTAQRARGSFREGLSSHEEFPSSRSASEKPSTVPSSFSSSSMSSTIALPAQGNRNVDGFSTKFGSVQFGYKPRKSKSEVTVKEKEKKKKSRHSGGCESASKESNEKANSKRYSIGDYLRQQIIDDLRNKNTVGKSAEEIAKERCKKVKAYLRSHSETLPRLVHVEEEEPNEDPQLKINENDDEILSQRIKDGLTRLREAIRQEDVRSKRGRNDENNSVDNESREASDETLKPEDTNVSRKIKNEELERVRSFLRRKIQQRMELEQSRSLSRSNTRPGVGIQKRYSDYRQPEDPQGYRTRKVRSETSVIRFDPEILQKDRQKAGSSRQIERERSLRSDRSRSKDSFGQKAYRRSRSETILEAAETTGTNRRQSSQTREPAEKRKLYRKTKSDVLLGQMGGSLDSEQENPPRRVGCQDTVEESWRQYKERKKHERQHRESDAREVKEEDFMSKPRWKDLQTDLCSFKNCKVCQNLQNCLNPLLKQANSPENQGTSDDGRVNLGDSFTVISNDAFNGSVNDRPSTSLQENYLVVDKKPDTSRNHILAKVQAKNHETNSFNVNSPDCGYSTIPKKAFNDYKELYTRSNVKKSDTFKIVDGSEELPSLGQCVERSDSKGNLDEQSADNTDCSNSGGVLTNKSNEDIARDYFKRVYELLKKRQEEAKKIAEKQEAAGCDDSSSSNYKEKVQKRRLRRKKKERSTQGKK